MTAKKKSKNPPGTLITNRQARRNYEIIETFEAGIELRGTEVKSLRNQKANMTDSFARIDNGEVTFTYKDRQNKTTRKMILSGMEFIRRFLLHVLPRRFMKIRYYGFLANICKRNSVLLIRRLIGKAMAARVFIKETIQEKVLRLTGKDILLCPHCRQGRMIPQRMLPALNTG
jgi:hypothetical protein